MAQEQILLADDDQDICIIVKSCLENSGYLVSTVSSGPEALSLAKMKNFDLFLLDIMLPGLDGLEVCQRLRQDTKAPIIFITSRTQTMDKVYGLASGADDYLTKPFHLEELLARVRALIRRANWYNLYSDSQNHKLTYPDLVINLNERSVLYTGNPVILTAKEFNMLSLLAANPGIVFNAEQLYHTVWQNEPNGDIRTVMVHVSSLRKKIEPANGRYKYIHTLKNAGYKFEPI